jgi:hypothetical protein
MLANILGKHPDVFAFHELHFLEDIWVPGSVPEKIGRDAAAKMLGILLYRERVGYHAQLDQQKLLDHSNELLNGLRENDLKPSQIFSHFLYEETRLHGKTIPCEQTPRNLFYAREIIKLYPEARIINLVRDPRDVLLSQKNKWKRRLMGNKGITYREVIRLKLNYHPYTISRLWKSCISYADKMAGIDRFFSLRFEDLVSQPASECRRICDFIGISFIEEMLEVEHLSSSFKKSGTGEKGVNKSALFRWKKGGLTKEERQICQDINRQAIISHGYELENDIDASKFKIILSYGVLPFQIALSLIFNFSRYKNVIKSVARRLKTS